MIGRYTLARAAMVAALAAAILAGCSKEPDVTPEQQAELDRSRDQIGKRGWLEVDAAKPASAPAANQPGSVAPVGEAQPAGSSAAQAGQPHGWLDLKPAAAPQEAEPPKSDQDSETTP